jgi:hypothetical protein
MGKYHSNAEEIPTIGRELRSPTGHQAQITTLNRMVKPGEVLVGYYDAMWRKIAPVLERQAQLDDFFQQYASGHFVRMGYYAVPEGKLRLEGA